MTEQEKENVPGSGGALRALKEKHEEVSRMDTKASSTDSRTAPTGAAILSAARNYFEKGRCSGHAQFNGRYCRDVAGWEQWCIHCAGLMLLNYEAETLALWQEQDRVLQEIAGLVDDEHVTCPADVLVAVQLALEERRTADALIQSSEERPSSGSALNSSSSSLIPSLEPTKDA